MSNDYYQPMHTVQCFATLKYDVIYYNLETRILETRYKVVLSVSVLLLNFYSKS